MTKITIKEVAKAANVSISTVSKVINDAPTISDGTKERVRKIMDEMNYYPNMIARSFVTQNSKNIGVVMELKRNYAFLNSHIYEILGGIEEILSKNGYIVTLLNSSSIGNQSEPYEKMIKEKRIDGLIMHVSNLNKSLCKKMDKMNFPYIVIGQPAYESNVCWIDINNKAAGEIAAKHLKEQGFERIAYIGGMEKDNVSNNRKAGIKSFIESCKLKVYNEFFMKGEPTIKNSQVMMDQLLSLEEIPDSVICLNNFVAFGALKSIKNHGLNIPKDMGMISFDNYPLSMFTEPELSVVDNDVFELGTHAAKALLDKIENPNLRIQYSMLSPNLIIRETSKRK